jgi:hypothetical protein
MKKQSVRPCYHHGNIHCDDSSPNQPPGQVTSYVEKGARMEMYTRNFSLLEKGLVSFFSHNEHEKAGIISIC